MLNYTRFTVPNDVVIKFNIFKTCSVIAEYPTCIRYYVPKKVILVCFCTLIVSFNSLG